MPSIILNRFFIVYFLNKGAGKTETQPPNLENIIQSYEFSSKYLPIFCNVPECKPFLSLPECKNSHNWFC